NLRQVPRDAERLTELALDVPESDDPDRSRSVEQLLRPVRREDLRFQVVAVDEHWSLKTGEAVDACGIEATSADDAELGLATDNLIDEAGFTVGLACVASAGDRAVDRPAGLQLGRVGQMLVILAWL